MASETWLATSSIFGTNTRSRQLFGSTDPFDQVHHVPVAGIDCIDCIDFILLDGRIQAQAPVALGMSKPAWSSRSLGIAVGQGEGRAEDGHRPVMGLEHPSTTNQFRVRGTTIIAGRYVERLLVTIGYHSAITRRAGQESRCLGILDTAMS